MSSIALQTVTSVTDILQSIAQLKDKSFHVYSSKELLDLKSNGIRFPAAGVIYEGMRAVETGGGTTHRTGLSVELVLSVILVYGAETMGATAVREEALDLLDTFRNKIKGTKAPSGHYWRFVVEGSALEKSGAVVWLQRWTVPVQLT